MNIARMRFIDKWLGMPVCLVLTLWRRVAGLFGRTPGVEFQPRRILFVKLAEQGSTVLAQGALQSAVQRVGRENVFFLLFAENRPILDLLDLIPEENVIAINARGLFGAIKGSLGAIWRMRRLGIDVVIDLEFFARSSAALCYLSGARWRVGFHAFGGEASYRGDLMTHRLSFNPYLHTSRVFQMMVDALDQPARSLPTFPHIPQVANVATRFEPTREEIEEVRGKVRELLGYRRPMRLILLNANASDLIPLRRWSPERYVELARKLLARYPEACIAFTGAPGEAAAAEQLVRQVGSERCASMAGKTTLRQLLVLCGLAEVLVTNDSGPAHFATLTAIDVVVLFGPETPKLFASQSARTHALWAGLACSPCINAFNDRNSPCTNNLCMQHITVDQVFAEVCRWYESRQAVRTLPKAA
ncbi:MAG: glycosyltransferase family 9 protein [Planctomycetes bacterium]|nr:glycosyltransferase family 9 protein [Planctomycetota bacterium]